MIVLHGIQFEYLFSKELSLNKKSDLKFVTTHTEIKVVLKNSLFSILYSSKLRFCKRKKTGIQIITRTNLYFIAINLVDGKRFFRQFY